MTESQAANDDLVISPRRLAELLYRRGGLAPALSGGVDGSEGIRAQKRAEEALRSDPAWESYQFFPERSFSSHLQIDGHRLQLRGRCDLYLEKEARPVFFEMKAYRGAPDFLPSEGLFMHWAQLMFYAALWLEEQGDPDKDRDSETLELHLLYCPIDSEGFLEKTRWLSRGELRRFLYDSLRDYANRVANLILWKENRDRSILASRFPYPGLRGGQEIFMRESLSCLRDKGVLFAEAPTGIGKTMAVLYPAIKALAASYVRRVFYATAMTSTRELVVRAANDLREAGFLLRSLCLTAKETLCPRPDIFCDQQICPYAASYYDRLPDALPLLLQLEEISAPKLLDVAEKLQLCPFELSLDIAPYCDLIIGDYNHIFDPRIRLQRFFDEEAEAPIALLVDEAHNLPRRSREMYSAVAASSDIAKLLAYFEGERAPFAGGYAKLRNELLELNQCFAACGLAFCDPSEAPAGFTSPENNPLTESSLQEDWYLSPDFISLRGKPEKLLRRIGRLLFLLRQFFDQERDFPDKRLMLRSFFELLHFHRMADQYYGDNYLLAGRKTGDDLRLYLLCLDASAYLSEVYYNRHPLILFSATLFPQPYYEAFCYRGGSEMPARCLELSSPFPRENRLCLAYTKPSLLFRERQQSLGDVRDAIFAACGEKVGNYLVFCPSFAYLREMRKLLKQSELPRNTRFLLQEQGMSERQKSYFLQRFEQYGEESLIAFAVLGSLFNEGIDLRGERLSGVIVIGVGLPGLSPEREFLSQYCSRHFGDGFLYAYVFPAFTRVQQAAGRLIRSEDDRGFVLLIDRRWEKPPYRELLPASWETRFLQEKEALIEEIREFWEQQP